MEATFTPGPWEMWPTINAEDPTNYRIDASTHDITAWVDEEANARLIAAAPDLLEALESLVAAVSEIEDLEHDQFGCDDEHCPLCQARAAISKATGK